MKTKNYLLNIILFLPLFSRVEVVYRIVLNKTLYNEDLEGSCDVIKSGFVK